MPPPRHPAQRSNIRTRSQQQQPLVPADLTASPFKAIRRQNQIATVIQNAQTSTTEHQHEQQSDILLANGKRSPPPASPSHPHDWKRQRVSPEEDDGKAESAPSSQMTSTNCPSTPTSPQVLFPREPVHLNLARISQSPPKPVASPARMFKITTQAGGTVEVPVTPARRPTLNPETILESIKPHLIPTLMKHAEISSHTTPARASDITNDIAHPQPFPCLIPAAEPNATSSTNDVTLPTISFPSRPEISAPTSPRKAEHVLPFKTPVRPRETLAPGPSRLPKPSSSLRISSLTDNVAKTPTRVPNPMAATISSMAKAKPRISPMRLRSRPQLKAKLGIKDRTPASKLALKRTMRRTSLNKGKGKGVPLTSVNAPGALANAVDKSFNGSKQSSIKAFFQQRPSSSRQALPAMGSPSKPTPLVALSTALKRLEVSAPLPPTRPAINSGPTESTDAPTTQTVPEKTQEDTLDAPKSNLATTGSPKMTPKAHLPMRLPSNPDINGRSIMAVSKSPTSKKNSLTCINPSIESSEETQDEHPNGESTPKPSEVVDVESWSDKTAEEQKENKPPLEFFVPLADELSMKPQALAQISPSRRASQASAALTESLSAPNRQQIFPQARSVSTSHLQLNARSPVKTRGKTKPQAPVAEPATQTTGKRSNARMPGSLDVLKDCVIFVDVKTEEGEDAAPLFVDMLRGLGARILSKPGKSCTHLVFKAGMPSTVVKYKLLPQPKPLVVSIGWVVECVEKRSHVEETRFLVNLDDFDITGGSLRRRSLTMQPKQIRALILGQLDPGDSGDSGTNGDASFTSEGSSAAANLSPPQRTTAIDNLPPLERARQRSQRFFRKK